MKLIKKIINKNEIMQRTNDKEQTLFTDSFEILESWTNVCNIGTDSELREAQLGALFSIKAHRIVSNEAATVVMPTGTGKTETMIAAVVSEKINKTLIVVPSNLLRTQTVEKFAKFGVLKDIGVIDKNALYPVVACLKSQPKTQEELEEIVDSSNVIITSMSLIGRFDNNQIDMLLSNIDLFIVDEAHHIAANKWSKIKYKFKDIPCLQFTATPFRNDGKKVDGRIIYNYPLSKAQENGYFQKIDFKPIKEFNESKSDFSIAEKAVEQLETDMNNGYDHIVLVRAKDKISAERLYQEIYQPLYNKYNPVLIHSGLSKSIINEKIKVLNSGESKIVVCVDMFGEGIDIPNLKIAAIHDKYKSLPITLQFIGRIARTSKNLGNATVITNIVNEELAESINELYAQDSDWNQLLSELSGSAIDKELSQQRFTEGFNNSHIAKIVKQLHPKVSTVVYESDKPSWNVNKLCREFDRENCFVSYNDSEKVVIVIEKVDNFIEWTNYKGIFNQEWKLHIAYWNEENKMCFVNSSDKSSSSKIAELLFEDSRIFNGERVFRCLYGINRLMLGTVGLKTNMNSIIRYKMFAGMDVGEGISESIKEDSTKSNLFGIGYNGNGKISIGCSYKGRIWSRWVESIDFWKKWCDDIASKLSDSTIDTSEILKGALIPKEIFERPKCIPYSIEWPLELDYDMINKIEVIYNRKHYQLDDVNLNIINASENGPLVFEISNDEFAVEFEFKISNNGFSICKESFNDMSIIIGRKEYEIVEYFNSHSPIIKFTNSSSLEGNWLVESNINISLFNKDNLFAFDWTDVDIQRESQGDDKDVSSIQFSVIQKLKEEQFSIVFNDDNAGEIADIICIDDSDDSELIFKLYHCKYSHSPTPGCRINDLYEVCGQAEKSVRWIANKASIIPHMKNREIRKNEKGISRFELGSLEKLDEINNKMKFFKSRFEIYIVQPGVSIQKITPEMQRLFGCTEAYLKDTYGIPLKVICSC